VKSAKFLFYRVVGASILAIDELRTLAYEISAILNTRLEVLTPVHFLKGSSYTKFPEPNITHLREGRLSRWQRVSQMQQHFWKRWNNEYLSFYLSIYFSNIKVGSIVLLKEDNVPPLRWQLGCIQEVIPGGDEVIGVAMVRTATGLIKRAVAKLAVLPIDSEIVGTLPLPTGRLCSEQIASA